MNKLRIYSVFSILIGILFLLSRGVLTNLSLLNRNLDFSSFDYYIFIITWLIISIFLFLFGIINLVLSFLANDYSEMKDFYLAGFKNVGNIFQKLLIISLFLFLCYGYMVAMFFPEYLIGNNGENEQRKIGIQIFSAVAMSGMIGGCVREIFFYLEEKKSDREDKISIMGVLFRVIGALFIAVVTFLLLRAGILQSVKVDTFNIYGVSGVAAITGYFSDKIVNRFSNLYSNLFESKEKPKN